jgi:hypothetical protein
MLEGESTPEPVVRLEGLDDIEVTGSAADGRGSIFCEALEGFLVPEYLKDKDPLPQRNMPL